MPQPTTRSSRTSYKPQKPSRQTRSAVSSNNDIATPLDTQDSGPVPKPPKQSNTNTKRSIVSRSTKQRKGPASPQATEDGSEDDAGGEESADEENEDDEQPAVIAPSCDPGPMIHEAGHSLDITQGSNVHTTLEISRGTSGNESLDSDDDDYAAVDEISDSDEEDTAVERLEEEMIINSYQGLDLDDFPILSAPGLEVYPQSWAGFGTGDGLFLANDSFFGDPADTDEIYGATSPLASDSRHVRFADPMDDDSTNTTSSDGESNPFTDIFLQQDRLPASIQSAIENEPADGDQSFSENEWDLTQDEHNGLEAFEQYGLANDDDSSESSGSTYDSDDGETTDEDLPPPPIIAHPRSILREDSTESSDSPSQSRRRHYPRRHTLNGPLSPRAMRDITRTGPRMGSWIADPDKNVAYLGPTGKLLYIRTARQSAQLRNGMDLTSISKSPRGIYEMLNDSENDASRPTSPMLSTDVNLMMSHFFHRRPGSGQLRGGQVTGPVEAFYPFQGVATNNAVLANDGLDDEEESYDDSMLDVEDYIDFGDVQTEDESGADDNKPHSKGKGLAIDASNGGVSEQSHLNHLDGHNVTAFRRNTTRFHAILKRPKHREFNPLCPPETPSAVKYGRQSELSSPIAPPRKRKHDNSSANIESSLANTVQRTFVHAHKRSKSSVQ